MFESYSSSTNQSAVEKLIQLATGKKTPAWVEEDQPAAPEAVEATAPPAEAGQAQSAEEPRTMEGVAEVPTEPARESSAEDSHDSGYDTAHDEPHEPPHEAMIEEVLAEATSEAEHGQAAPEHGMEEAVDERPFHEQAPESVVEQGGSFEAAPNAPREESVSEPASEPVAEAVAEQRLMESPAAEPEDMRAEEAAAEGETQRAFHSESPFEAAVQPDHAAGGAAEAELVEQEAGSLEPEPALAAEPVDAAEQVDDRPFHTPVAEPMQEATPTAEADMGEEQKIGAAEAERTAEFPRPASTAPEAAARAAVPPASERLRSIPRFAVGDPQVLGTQGGKRGADVVPSPGETTYLRSKSGDGQPDEITEEELRQLAQDPMWKTLVQFKAWLPVVTRVLPLLDMARNRPQGGGVTAEMQDAMEGLLVSHKDVRATLQGQTTELKRVEDEVAKLRDAMDKTTFEQTTVAEDMRSTQRMVKNASMYMGILLGLLVAVVGYMAFLVFTYLNHPAH